MHFANFQTSRHGSPTLDFAYFFYTCSPKNVLNNVDKYLVVYHDSLSEFLGEFGSNPEKVFPRSLLWGHWKKYNKFGLVTSNILFKFILVSEDESLSIDEGEFAKAVIELIKNEKLCNERGIDVITHFCDRNLI